MGPLHGIKILDLSRILAGPWATQCLADFGATVWKIEKPGSGDDTRHWGPPWVRDGKGKDTGESAYFASTNRGKHSIAIDFTKPAGQQIVRSLAMRADVLIENFKVGTLAKYRLGYESLKGVNPRLVYCSISAFGQDGPAANEPGYDAMIQAISGLMSVTGVPDGEPGAGPVKVGVAVSDLVTGMYAATAILAALVEREQSGRGEYIDLALLDTQVAALANQTLNYLVTGKSPRPPRHGAPEHRPLPGLPDEGCLADARGRQRPPVRCRSARRRGSRRSRTTSAFATNAGRVKNRVALVSAVEKLCRTKTTKGWVKLLTRAGVPCGPINSIAEVFAEPQVKHRKLRFELPHALGGKLPQVKNPVFFSRNTLDYSMPPPLLGAHTRAGLVSRTRTFAFRNSVAY